MKNIHQQEVTIQLILEIDLLKLRFMLANKTEFIIRLNIHLALAKYYREYKLSATYLNSTRIYTHNRTHHHNISTR